jgi:hypothetical protein
MAVFTARLNPAVFHRPWATRVISSAARIQRFSDAVWNCEHWQNDQWENVMREAEKTVDMAQRNELVAEAMKIDHDEAGYLVWSFMDLIDGKSDKIAGEVPDVFYWTAINLASNTPLRLNRCALGECPAMGGLHGAHDFPSDAAVGQLPVLRPHDERAAVHLPRGGCAVPPPDRLILLRVGLGCDALAVSSVFAATRRCPATQPRHPGKCRQPGGLRRSPRGTRPQPTAPGAVSNLVAGRHDRRLG